MSDIFDLEQDIIRCWSVTNDIGETLEDLENQHIDQDTAVEAFRAYQRIYSLRFERCWRNFEGISEQNRVLRQRVQDLEQQIQLVKTAKSAGSKRQKKVDQ